MADLDKQTEAVLVSKRPQTTKDVRERISSERDDYLRGLDVEMRADMDPLLKDDPIARLGYDPDKIDYIEDRGGLRASYEHSSDEVSYGPETGASEDVIAHEVRHRGIELLTNLYEKDPTAFVEKYGSSAATVLTRVGSELQVEFRDNPDATWLGSLGVNKMEDTLDSITPEMSRRYLGTGEIKTGSDHNDDILTKGFEGLDRAALDLMKERGDVERVYPKEVEKKGFFRRLLGFNEGGTVMANSEDQMSALFEEGGMADEGMETDPVSGNEVPTGSLPEEVRDDIPAQLSEGEYVVPADVVRFFGVKFFEDIRNEAKRGFADMEANGRIGGEPVGETGMEMGGDELPFDVSELQMVEDSSEEQPMMNQGGFISGYAEGGEASLPYHVATGSDSSGFEIRTFIGADGTKYYIQFMNGKPLTPIPDGATQEATAAEEVSTQVETAAETGTVTSNDNDSTPPPPPAEAIDWSDPTVATPEKFLSTYEGLEGMGTGLSFGAGLMLGPLAGLGVKGLMKLQKNSMLKGLDSQIESLTNTGNTSQVKKLEEIRNLMQGKNADGSEKKGAPTGIDVLTSGETYKGNSITESLANILTKGDGKSYRNGVLVDDVTGAVLEPGFANSKSNDPVSTPTSQPTAQPSQNNGGGNNDSGNNAHESMMKVAAEAKASKTGSNLAKVKEKSESAYKAATSTKKELDSQYGSGLNKGGLMKKK